MRYRDPAYGPDFIFPAERLPGAESPPNVLKPQDLDPRQNREWRPRMGFGERRDQGNLGQAGHRMLGHHVPRYGAVPPPIQVKENETYRWAKQIKSSWKKPSINIEAFNCLQAGKSVIFRVIQYFSRVKLNAEGITRCQVESMRTR